MSLRTRNYPWPAVCSQLLEFSMSGNKSGGKKADALRKPTYVLSFTVILRSFALFANFAFESGRQTTAANAGPLLPHPILRRRPRPWVDLLSPGEGF